jgi:hypothetical protein
MFIHIVRQALKKTQGSRHSIPNFLGHRDRALKPIKSKLSQKNQDRSNP